VTVHGKNTGVAIGQFDITRWLNSVSSTQDIDNAEASNFDEPGGAKVFVNGLRDGKVSWTGRIGAEVAPSATVQGVFDDIQAADTVVPFLVGPDRGFAPGRSVMLGSVYSTTASITSPIGDVVSINGDLQAEAGFSDGVCLTQKAPYSTSATGTTVDSGANSATSGGGRALLIMDQRGTRDGVTNVSIQHSVDGTTWVDLLVFTTIAAGNGSAQLVDFASGTLINRYLRAVVTLSGTAGQATIRVALARRK
jgi:hypothetical protein